MAKRRIMVKAKLLEISAVDRPAQPDAKMVLRKRADVSHRNTKSSDEPTPAGSADSNVAGNQHEPSMTPEQVLALQKRAERAEKALALSTAERELFAKMNTKDQDAFLALSPELRAAEVQKVQDSNPVVYKSTDGREFRKSDDARLVEMAKRLDAAEEKTRKAEERARLERIAKRAAGLSRLPGDSADHVLLVEAVDKMDAEQQTKLNTLLDKLNGEFGKAFARVGTSAAPANSSAEDKIEAIAKRIQDADPKLTPAQAYAKAMRSPEGQAAYAEHRESLIQG